MISLEALASRIGSAEAWEQRSGTSWLSSPSLDVRRMAQAMVDEGARLVTITARLVEDGPLHVGYHWDLEGRLLTLETAAAGGRLPSIHDLTEAADWIERELHETYAVELEGRAYEPLLLRPGQAPGVNLPGDDE